MIYKNFLAKELIKWLDEGLIDKNLANKLALRYNIDLNSAQNSTNFILQIVAYLFFGCSIMVLVGANWDEIPEFVRSTTLILLTVIVNLAGFYQHKNGNEKYATALFFLGTLVFCASIALIAQIYHLDKHMPNGVLLAAIGSMILGVGFKDSFVTAVALCIAIFWVFVSFEYISTIEPSFVIFLLFSLYVFLLKGGKFLAFALFCGVYSYVFSPNISYFDSYFLHSFMLLFATLAYLLLGVAIKEPLIRLGRAESGIGFYQISVFFSFFILIALQISSFQNDFFDVENRMEFFINSLKSYYGILFVSLIAISATISIYFKNKTLFFVSILLSILPIVALYTNGMHIVFSLASVLAGGALIKSDRLFDGLSLIFVTVIIRYIDLVGDYIGASALFLVFAITMLMMARKRRAK